MGNFLAQVLTFLALGNSGIELQKFIKDEFFIRGNEKEMILSVFFAGYVVGSFVEGFLGKVIGKLNRVIVIGILSSSVWFIVVSQVVVQGKFISVILGFWLLGISASFMYSKLYLVPTILENLKTATDYYYIENNNNLINIICCLSCSFLSLSQILGFLLSKILFSIFTYHSSYLILSIIYLISGFLYSFINDVFNLFTNELTDKLNELEIVDLGDIKDDEEICIENLS